MTCCLPSSAVSTASPASLSASGPDWSLRHPRRALRAARSLMRGISPRRPTMFPDCSIRLRAITRGASRVRWLASRAASGTCAPVLRESLRRSTWSRGSTIPIGQTLPRGLCSFGLGSLSLMPCRNVNTTLRMTPGASWTRTRGRSGPRSTMRAWHSRLRQRVLPRAPASRAAMCRLLLPTVSRASALSQRISLGVRPIWPIACLSPRILRAWTWTICRASVCLRRMSQPLRRRLSLRRFMLVRVMTIARCRRRCAICCLPIRLTSWRSWKRTTTHTWPVLLNCASRQKSTVQVLLKAFPVLSRSWRLSAPSPSFWRQVRFKRSFAITSWCAWCYRCWKKTARCGSFVRPMRCTLPSTRFAAFTPSKRTLNEHCPRCAIFTIWRARPCNRTLRSSTCLRVWSALTRLSRWRATAYVLPAIVLQLATCSTAWRLPIGIAISSTWRWLVTVWCRAVRNRAAARWKKCRAL